MRRRARELASAVCVALVAPMALGLVTQPAAAAASRTWTGGGATSVWSDPTNWGGTAPVAGDDLVFPASSGSETTNDLATGTAFSSISAAGVWTLAGNRVGLTRGVALTSSATLFLDLPVDLLADQGWNTATGIIYLDAALRTGGHALAFTKSDLNASSAVWIQAGVSGGGTLSSDGASISVVGPAPVNAAVRLTESGGLGVGAGSSVVGAVDVTSGSVGGTGRIDGPVNVRLGGISAGLTVADLTLDGGTVFFTNLTPNPAFGTQRTITVDGAVNLGDAHLNVNWSGTPEIGSRYTLVDNRGSTPIVGRFHGLPEGQHFINRSVEFSITYAGDDGNDVVITVERLDAVQRISMAGGRFNEDVGIATMAITADMPDLSRGRAMRLDAREGSATANDYYDGFWAVLNAGETIADGQVGIVNDATVEPDESFRLRLSDTVDGSSGAATTLLADVEVVIADDDSPPPPSALPPPPPAEPAPTPEPASSTPAPTAPASSPARNGYWTVDNRGAVFAHGDAPYLGGSPVLRGGETVTAISGTPSGGGYWLFTSIGRVMVFGDAPHLGDMSGVRLNGPVLDSVPTTSGRGYYMVASDGGIFTFGDATFLGSMGSARLNKPVQSLVPDTDGSGYWLVASDGGIFAFDAPFYGSMGSTPLNAPVTGMVGYANGYLMVGEDGGIFTFGDAPFFGSLGENPPSRAIVAVAALHR